MTRERKRSASELIYEKAMLEIQEWNMIVHNYKDLDRLKGPGTPKAIKLKLQKIADMADVQR